MLNLLLPLGLILQASALAVLVIGESTPAIRLLAFAAAQVAASALLAPALLDLIPVSRNCRRQAAIAYLFALNLAMPVVGVACLLAGYHLARRFPAKRIGNPIAFLDEPVFTLHRDKEGSGFRGGQVRAQLMDPGTPLNQKMGALVSIQDTPTRVTKDILKGLLADPGDDIRLLAYGILDSKEKEIMARILELQDRSREAGGAKGEEILSKQLAELYWELIYQNLVQGDMRAFSADRVRHHVRVVLRNRDNGGLWFLLARLELLMGKTDAAQDAIEKARETNFPNERLLPYLAELRFLQRRYKDVQATLLRMVTAGTPLLDPALRYWLDIKRSPQQSDLAGFAAIPSLLGKQQTHGLALALPSLDKSHERGE